MRIVFSILLLLLADTGCTYPEDTEKARLIVLADMGNEPDEEQQITHLLVCSNEMELEGLIAVTGAALNPNHPDPYKRVLHPELFHRLIDAYGEVYPNLQKHADGWHSPEYLHSIVASGQTGYGIEAIGKGKSTEGSELIIRQALNHVGTEVTQ